MAVDDDDQGTEDIDQADLDDLGELGDGDEDGDEGGAPKGKPIPDAETWEKIQRKLARQEERITRLVGAKGKGGGASVDRQLAAQLRGGKGKADEDDEPADDGEAARWRDIAVRNAASAQISAAGFTGTAKQAARLARLIETSSIEPDRNGVFDLEDEIDELKEEYPQLFSTAGDGRRRAPVVRRGDSRETGKKDPTLSTTDKMLKAAGYR